MKEESKRLTFEELANAVTVLEKRFQRNVLRAGNWLSDISERQARQEEKLNKLGLLAWFALGFAATAAITAIMVWVNR